MTMLLGLAAPQPTATIQKPKTALEDSYPGLGTVTGRPTVATPHFSRRP